MIKPKIKLISLSISIGVIAILTFQSCGEKKTEEASIQDASSFEFEIQDSVMVDYLGSMSWSDISKDGKHILAYDNQTSDILLLSSEGEVLGKFNKSGDQPDAIGSNPISRPQFVKADEWAILGKKGVYSFSFDGELTRTAKPDFTVSISLSISNAKTLQFLNEDKALIYYLGRDNNSSFYVSPTSSQLEIADLKEGDFKAILPFPDGSKYKNPEKIHTVLTTMPAMTISKGKLYLAFKNEPKLWIYDIDNLSTPLEEININFSKFIEKEGMSPSEVDDKSFGINPKDFTYGTIDNVFVHDELIFINYTEGVSDAEYEKIKDENSDFNQMISGIFKANKSAYAVLDKNGQLKPLEFPKRTRSIEFIDSEGNFWLSYNKEEELDYELIFKSKLRSKK